MLLAVAGSVVSAGKADPSAISSWRGRRKRRLEDLLKR